MKLYTEEQVKSAIIDFYRNDYILTHPNLEKSISLQTPIELPSDEEIEKQSPFKESAFGFEQGQYQGFISGAKWLKEQITKTK